MNILYMEQKINKSNTIYIMKGFAIFSVLCAHTSIVPRESSVMCKILSEIMNEIGAVGVGVFFVISGYLFYFWQLNNVSFKSFIIKKIKYILVPWVVSATLVYFYVAVRKGGSLKEFILLLVGYESSYWYLSILFVLYIVFYILTRAKHKTFCVVGMICMSIVSVCMRVVGIIPADAIGVYLNVFNWSAFFAVGVIIQSKSIKFLNSILCCVSICIICILSLALCERYFGQKFSYFAHYYIGVELIIVLAVYSVSELLARKDTIVSKILIYVGRISFSLYLYHQLIWAGFIVNITNRYDKWYLIMLRPFVVGGLVVIELKIGDCLARKINKRELYGTLTGMR